MLKDESNRGRTSKIGHEIVAGPKGSGGKDAGSHRSAQSILALFSSRKKTGIRNPSPAW